jgi:hypothetical protein
LVGTMARTAVVAGTATAVHSSMTGKKQSNAQAEADTQAAQQATYENQAQLADMQRQLDASQAVQAAAAAPTAAAPAAAAPAAAAGDDLMSQLSKLADLKAAGILSDEEFTAAKAKLLGT